MLSTSLIGHEAQSVYMSLMQGLLGVTLSAGVPALQDGSHVNRVSFYLGFLYLIALGQHPIGLCILRTTCQV